MLRNFFIVAFRNLNRNKIFATINILGLAIGMASAMLIGLWIRDEFAFDRFHAKEDRLYMMYRQETEGQNGDCEIEVRHGRADGSAQQQQCNANRCD